MEKIRSLEELHRWVLNTNKGMGANRNELHQLPEINSVLYLIEDIASQIREEYPYYAKVLSKLKRRLFVSCGGFYYDLNRAVFGELYLIATHLHDEPSNVSFWPLIHPRVARAAKELYLDSHYAAAANRSMVEVESALRDLFKRLKPDAVVPTKVGDLIGALLTENGAYRFCDDSEASGRDYRKGIQLLFEGAFRAYRNPSSHANLSVSKNDAFAQIVLASQLMDVLEPRS